MKSVKYIMLSVFSAGVMGVFASSDVTSMMIDSKVQQIINEGPCALTYKGFSPLFSIREIIEKQYFLDSGCMLSSCTLDERITISKRYLNSNYDMLLNLAKDSFAGESNLSTRVQIATFVASELFDDSLVTSMKSQYLKMKPESRELFAIGLGYVSDPDAVDILQQIAHQEDSRLFYSVLRNKIMKQLSSTNHEYNPYVIRELYQATKNGIEEDVEESRNFKSQDIILKSQVLQSLRFCHGPNLALLTSFSRETSAFLDLEAFKDVISFGREREYLLSVLEDYSNRTEELSAEEQILLDWVCITIRSRIQQYEGNDNIAKCLTVLSKKKNEYVSTSISITLKKLNIDNASGGAGSGLKIQD
jgi:hypothetical protein